MGDIMSLFWTDERVKDAIEKYKIFSPEQQITMLENFKSERKDDLSEKQLKLINGRTRELKISLAKT